VGGFVAVGGILIDATNARSLETPLDELCRKNYGFRTRMPFKWLPSKDHWMRENLIGRTARPVFQGSIELGGTARGNPNHHRVSTTKGLATGKGSIEAKCCGSPASELSSFIKEFSLSLSGASSSSIVVAPRGS
jgi:hypothetical protein